MTALLDRLGESLIQFEATERGQAVAINSNANSYRNRLPLLVSSSETPCMIAHCRNARAPISR
jgi:hypothetical protein